MKKQKSLLILGAAMVLTLALGACNNKKEDNPSSITPNSSVEEPSSNASSSILDSEPSSIVEPGTSIVEPSTSVNPPSSSSDSSSSSSSSSSIVKPDGAVDLIFAQEGDSCSQDNVADWLKADTPSYWADKHYCGSNVTFNYSYTHNDKWYVSYTTEGTNQWGANLQLFYKNSTLETGKKYKLTLDIDSNAAGIIRINEVEKQLEIGSNKLEVEYIEGGEQYASFKLITGIYNGGNPIQISAADFVISNLKWEGMISPLSAPEGIVISKVAEGHTIAFSAISGATGYKAKIYDGSKIGNAEQLKSAEVLKEVDVTNGGLIDTSGLDDNKSYKVFVKALGDNVSYVDSDYSAKCGILSLGQPPVQSPEQDTTILNGEEANIATDAYSYWADTNWCGSLVEMDTASVKGNTATFSYNVKNGSCSFGIQIFYKNTNLVNGSEYTVTCQISSSFAGTVEINGQQVTLVAGLNDVSIKYTEGGSESASFKIVISTDVAASATLKIIDLSWDNQTSTGGNTDTPSSGSTDTPSGGDTGSITAVEVSLVEFYGDFYAGFAFDNEADFNKAFDSTNLNYVKVNNAQRWCEKVGKIGETQWRFNIYVGADLYDGTQDINMDWYDKAGNVYFSAIYKGVSSSEGDGETVVSKLPTPIGLVANVSADNLFVTIAWNGTSTNKAKEVRLYVYEEDDVTEVTKAYDIVITNGQVLSLSEYFEAGHTYHVYIASIGDGTTTLDSSRSAAANFTYSVA